MINVDYSRDSLFDQFGLQRLKDSYMLPEEKSPQDRFAFISEKFSSNPEHAQRLYNYASKHWLSYSTPILSFGKTKRGLPISCYLSFLEDSREGLVDTLAETSWLSMLGGGVGIGVGIRSADDKSVGLMPHLKTYDACCLAYRQSTVRRGSYAIYLDIDHPDIMSFIEMRKPTGDQDNRCLNLHHAVNITDKFMLVIKMAMLDPNFKDDWELIDPHSKKVVSVISAKDLWQKLLELRMQTGEPYFHFIDTANQYLPKHLKKLGLKIRQSNLCVSGDTDIDIIVDDKYELKIAIKDLQFFDLKTIKVKSFNIETGKIEYKQILDFAMTSTSAEVIKITTSLGNELVCTPDHKLYTKNRGYVRAEDLVEDDELVEYPPPAGVASLKIEKIKKSIPVYDITVEDNHNFYANNIVISNCSEIELPTDKDRTAVCCLSSVNLTYWDDWKDDPLFISDCIEMLDNVLQYFIDNAPKEISKAIYSAKQERSVGLGALGFHALLQKKNIPFESALATGLNLKIFKHIKEEADKTNLRLGIERGEAPDAVGTGKRLSHCCSIAPNASSSIIMGNTSPSIEPFRANCYRQDTLSGSFLNKNPYLDELIRNYCAKNNKLDYNDIWSSIISNDGSVQHLVFLSDWEKDIFKTAMEIDQRWVVQHAADRQKFIDQGQSVNLFFRPDVSIKYLHAVHFEAWSKGLKALYYCRSESIGKADKLNTKIERKKIEDIDMQEVVNEESCLACEG